MQGELTQLTASIGFMSTSHWSIWRLLPPIRHIRMDDCTEYMSNPGVLSMLNTFCLYLQVLTMGNILDAGASFFLLSLVWDSEIFQVACCY